MAYSLSNEARLEEPYRAAIIDMGQEVSVFCVKDMIPHDSLKDYASSKSMTVLKKRFQPEQIKPIKDGFLGFNNLDISSLFQMAQYDCNIDAKDWKTDGTLAFFLSKIKTERNNLSHENIKLTRDIVVAKLEELKLLYRNVIMKLGEHRCAQGGTMTAYEQYTDAIVKRLDDLRPEITVADLAIQMEIQIGNLSSKIEKIPLLASQQTDHRTTSPYNVNNVVAQKKKVFIINNIDFRRLNIKRSGAEHDSPNLRSTFGNLGYEVNVHENLTATDTDHVLDQIQHDTSLDFLLLMILSLGKNSDTFITSDGQEYSLKSIQARFTDAACPHLKDKAKVIMCDYPRGTHIATDTDIYSEDAMHTTRKIPITRHMITIHSTREGCVAFSDLNKGTLFVYSLCEILRGNPNISISEAFNLLEEKMRKICDDQLPEMKIASPIPQFKF